MKVIQVKYMGCTQHKPARFKVWAEGLTPSIVSASSIEPTAAYGKEMVLAIDYATKAGWLENCSLAGGVLPNGNHCFVMVEKGRVM